MDHSRRVASEKGRLPGVGKAAAPIFILALLALPGLARATGGESSPQAQRGVGRVLRIDGPDAYIDLGRGQGADAGVEVTLYRLITAVDPETGARLEDRFRLVAVPIAEAGEVLSLVRLPPELAPLVNIGDEARLPAGARLPPAPSGQEAGEEVLVEPGLLAVDPPRDLEDLGRAFALAAGASFERRLSAWRAFVQAHPDSDMTPVVAREIAAIEGALRPEPEQPSRPAERVERSRPVMAVSAPQLIVAGEKLRVVVASLEERVPASALLYFQQPGQEGFRFKQMTPYGDGTFAAEVPGTMLEPPYLDWYVSVHDGSAEHRIGEVPRTTRIESRVEPSTPVDRSRVNLAFQYVDFYRYKHLDAYSQFEADFLYRILHPLMYGGRSFPQLYSLRVGFGAFHGIGGAVERVVEADERDSRRGLREVGFNFGYTELELRFSESFALMTRGIVGIGDAGLDAGLQGSVRLGPEAGTNLVLGALGVGQIGQAWHLQFAWNTVPKVPMNASVEVTTWPVGGEKFGVRLLYEARYRFTPWLEVGGRVGYGLRNINHGGMTLGLGTVFSW